MRLKLLRWSLTVFSQSKHNFNFLSGKPYKILKQEEKGIQAKVKVEVTSKENRQESALERLGTRLSIQDQNEVVNHPERSRVSYEITACAEQG